MKLKFVNQEVATDPRILSMLRGPDTSLPELKGYTVGRIRFMVLDKNYTEISVYPYKYPGNVTENKLDDEERSCRNRLLKEFASQSYGGQHFHYHYLNAVDAIRKHLKYDLLNEKEMEGYVKKG